MTYKAKLITSICAFFLVLALLAAGVWAAKTVNISIGGTVNFTATSVYCTVTGEVENAKTNPTLPQLDFSADTNPTVTWSPTDLSFQDEGTNMGQDINIVITVQNKADRRLDVTISEGDGMVPGTGYDIQNIVYSLRYGATETAAKAANPIAFGTTQQISNLGTGVFVITFHIETKNNPASLDYDFDVNLENAG